MTLAWFATKGSGTNEARRLQELVSAVPGAVELPFDKRSKVASLRTLWSRVRRLRPDLLVMEGTGIAGGLVCLAARLLLGTRYVVSSGDAVGPFVRAQSPWAGLPFALYERLLCRHAAGFIGWTPYLCGRAMTYGAPRAVTAPGWVLGGHGTGRLRPQVRAAWGVPAGALVIGLVGSLVWNRRLDWCYGMDLVKAAFRSKREDLAVVIVGDGDGLPRLRELAGEALGRRVFLPGPVLLEEVMDHLRAMDVGSLPQSVDGVGLFRYTTKLPEYAAAGLPVITNRVPVAYDLGTGWMWRLPGQAPWDPVYQQALELLLEGLDEGRIAQKRMAIPEVASIFDREAQVARVGDFLRDLLLEGRHATEGT